VSFGGGLARGSQGELRASSWTSANRLGRDQWSLAQDGVSILELQSATGLNRNLGSGSQVHHHSPGLRPNAQSAPDPTSRGASQSADAHEARSQYCQNSNIASSLAINGKAKKATHASLKIASLNVRGFGHQNVHHSSNKWNHINQLVRDKRIGVLLVQEVHRTQERCAQLEQLFSRRMKIFFLESPENPTGKGRTLHEAT
jgi:hypothetical protein